MTEQFSSPTPDEARRALSAAETAGVATSADRNRLERGLIGIGVAVGVLVLGLRLTVGAPDAPSWLRFGGFGVVMALYLAAITGAVLVMRRVSAEPRGYAVRYTVGLTATMAFYAVYVIVASTRGDVAIPWMWAVLAALGTATPALLAARSISKLSVR